MGVCGDSSQIEPHHERFETTWEFKPLMRNSLKNAGTAEDPGLSRRGGWREGARFVNVA